jgi:putative aldouronate transport system substrate-binding protein
MQPKKWIFLLLSIVLVTALLLTACQPKATEAPKPTEEKPAESPTEAPTAEPELPLVDIHWYFAVQKLPNESDLQAVTDYLNTILEKEINAHVILEPTDFATFGEKAPLMLASGEECDLIYIASWINNYAQNVNAETVLPLDDLLKEYAPEYYAQMPESMWNATRIRGNIYAGINQQINASSEGFWINNELAAEYGKKAEEINTLAEFRKYLEWIRDNKAPMIPYINGGGGVMASSWYYGFDDLTGVGVGVFATDPEGKVVNWNETEQAKASIALANDWIANGLMGTDKIAGSDQHSVLSAGQYGALAHVYKPIGGKELNSLLGGDWSVVKAEDGAYFLATGGIFATMTAICATSPNPERAAMVMNIVNTNEDFYNTLIYGLEGTHWNWVDKAEKVIELINPDTSGYNINVAWELGNTFRAYYTDPGLAEIDANPATEAYNNNAAPSYALGYVFDPEPVKNQVAQVTAVNKEYEGLFGGLMPAEKLDELIKKQKEAGMDEILAECERQLKEWKVANP